MTVFSPVSIATLSQD